MRRVASLGLCMGLGLALTARVSAQAPGPVAGSLPNRIPIGVLSDEEANKLPKRIPAVVDMPPPGAPGSSSSYCPACGGGVGHAPGVAYVGSHEEAPGYANVGDAGYPAGMGGPAPIGVMRTNYPSPYVAGPARGTAAPGQAASAPPQNLIPPPAPDTSRKNHWILGSMLGIPRPNALGAWQRERRREQHAAIRFDKADTGANSLPASVVYSR
jgi:hypothetical protein